MIKRLIAILALGAALMACTPAGGSGASPDLTTPTDAVSSMSAEPSMSVESASPSP